MRGCRLAPDRSERAITAEMQRHWLDVYGVEVKPSQIERRCESATCVRDDHWQRRRRKAADPLSAAEHKRMMLMVAEGKSQAHVARIFGVTQQAVSHMWKTFVPNYRGYEPGGARKGKRFSKRLANVRRRVIDKINKGEVAHG